MPENVYDAGPSSPIALYPTAFSLCRSPGPGS